MTKKIINTVTVTGADDSVSPEALIEIAQVYPFVEFGILLSKKWEGNRRFPSLDWMKELYQLTRRDMPAVRLSGHLCGVWMRDICLGGDSFFRERDEIWSMFGRFQLNFHRDNLEINLSGLSRIISMYGGQQRQFILQMDGVNNHIFHSLVQQYPGLYVAPLFDSSGGAGKLPQAWPEAITSYCGYAGGLSPDNLREQMEKIAVATGEANIWIDAEGRLRSENDTFDLNKVRRFLEAAKPNLLK